MSKRHLSFWLTLIILAAAVGCGPPSGSDDGRTSADTGLPEDGGGQTDSEPGSDGQSTDECSTNADCPTPDGAHYARAECRDGTCEPVCESGWTDEDGSAANGCECQPTQFVADCDSDGYVGADAAETTVCDAEKLPATPSSCSDSAQVAWTKKKAVAEPTDCRPDNPDAHPGVADADRQEKWRCDGLDNDCDGTVDEVCCERDETATVTTIANAPKIHASTVVPAVDPMRQNGAEFLVAWSQDQKIHLEHLRADGTSLPGGGTKVISTEVPGHDPDESVASELVVAADSEGYLLLYTVLTAEPVSYLVAKYLPAKLGPSPYKTTLIKKETHRENRPYRPEIASDGDVFGVSYTTEVGGDLHHIWFQSFKAQELSNGLGQAEVLTRPETGGALPVPAKSALAPVGDDFLVSWWNPGPKDQDSVTIHGGRISTGGEYAMSYSFQPKANGTQHISRVVDVHPMADQNSALVLYREVLGAPQKSRVVSMTVDLESGKVSNRQEVSETAGRHFFLELVGTRNGRALGVWRRYRDKNDDLHYKIMARRHEENGLSTPALVEQNVKSPTRNLYTLSAARSKRAIGVLSRAVKNQSRSLELALLSPEGTPLCLGNP